MGAKIAMDEIEEPTEVDGGKGPAAKALGKKGGTGRAASMTAERRAEIVKRGRRNGGAARLTNTTFFRIQLRSGLRNRCEGSPTWNGPKHFSWIRFRSRNAP